MKIATRISVHHSGSNPPIFFHRWILPPRGLIGSQIEWSQNLIRIREGPTKFRARKNGDFGSVRFWLWLGQFLTSDPQIWHGLLLWHVLEAREKVFWNFENFTK